MAIGFILSRTLQSKFRKYSQVPLTNGMSGAEVAAQMLRHFQIYDVQITHVEGQLTDHYNPQNKTVNLSQEVYFGRSVAAAAVAAHECGHAVQHATAYNFLQMRSALVPVVNIAASMQQYLFMFGLAGIGFFKSPILLIIALVAFGITALFSLITLPVEFNASSRAKVALVQAGIVDGGVSGGQESQGVEKVLGAAAWTYVAGFLASLLSLLYWVMLLTGNSRDD